MRHNIILAADQHYVPHMATAIRSLVENNIDLALNVHLINSDIDTDQWQRLERTVRGFDCQLIDAKLDPARVSRLVTRHHITSASYYRLLAPEMMPAATALYLDADIVVTGSIAGLVNGDRDGNAVSAVVDAGVKPHPDLGMTPGAAYLNSGVMRLDLDIWRSRDIGGQVISFIGERPEVVPFLDQCGLNRVLDGAWTPVDPAFNVQSGFWDLDAATAERQYGPGGVRGAMAHPRIVHFTGASKPWHLNNAHPLRALYWHYRRRTAFARCLPDDIGPRTLARKVLPDRLIAALKGR